MYGPLILLITLIYAAVFERNHFSGQSPRIIHSEYTETDIRRKCIEYYYFILVF